MQVKQMEKKVKVLVINKATRKALILILKVSNPYRENQCRFHKALHQLISK